MTIWTWILLALAGIAFLLLMGAAISMLFGVDPRTWLGDDDDYD